jgi:hypothetical protein
MKSYGLGIAIRVQSCGVKRAAFIIFALGALAGCGHGRNQTIWHIGQIPKDYSKSSAYSGSSPALYDRKRAEEIQQFVWQLEARQKLEAEKKRENSN